MSNRFNKTTTKFPPTITTSPLAMSYIRGYVVSEKKDDLQHRRKTLRYLAIEAANSTT